MALTLKQALAQFWIQITNKFVSKENGKGLSTNDFTTEEKNKLASLENITIDTTLTTSNAAADAKVTGDRIAKLSEEIAKIPEPYTLPIASADTLGGVKVGSGLQMAGDVLGVKPEGVYELIETITIDVEGIRRYDRTKTPDGLNYNFKKLMVKIISEAHESSITVAFSAYIDNKFYLYDYQPNAIRKNYASICREFFAINTDGTAEIKSIVSSTSVSAVGMTNNREYKQTGIDTNASIVKLIISADGADIPVGTVIEIWGVRADA